MSTTERSMASTNAPHRARNPTAHPKRQTAVPHQPPTKPRPKPTLQEAPPIVVTGREWCGEGSGALTEYTMDNAHGKSYTPPRASTTDTGCNRDAGRLVHD